jgi:hypothetical protein
VSAVDGPGDSEPERVAGEVAATVRQRRSEGAYGASLVQRVETDSDTASPDRWRSAAAISIEQPALSSRRLLGPAAVRAKRVVRRLVGWYVQPVATQQTAFNLMLLDRIAGLERRIAELGPVWTRDAGSPPAEEGGEQLTHRRAEALLRACGQAPAGAVLIGGPNAAQLLDAVRSVPRQMVVVSDVLQELSSEDRAPYAVIVLAGVLPLLGPGDLLRCLPRAASRMLAGGVLLADTPRAAGEDLATRDFAHLRGMTGEQLRALSLASGLRDVTVQEWHELSPPWCVVQAQREA